MGRTWREGGGEAIQIDVDADLNMVDDDDRNVARRPGSSFRLRVGGVAVAGRPGFWSWMVIEDIDDTSVVFRQVSARETAAFGHLTVAAPA
jgi:hypothetical protein